jgi:hypothetical protein
VILEGYVSGYWVVQLVYSNSHWGSNYRGRKFLRCMGWGNGGFSGTSYLIFVKFCQQAEDIRTFEDAQKNRKSNRAVFELGGFF